MKKILFLTVILFSCVTIFGLFKIKHEVQELKKELVITQRQIVMERKAIHVLNAEWAYLNNPDRIGHLANKHLKVASLAATQVREADAISHIYMASNMGEGEPGSYVTPVLRPVLSSW